MNPSDPITRVYDPLTQQYQGLVWQRANDRGTWCWTWAENRDAESRRFLSQAAALLWLRGELDDEEAA